MNFIVLNSNYKLFICGKHSDRKKQDLIAASTIKVREIFDLGEKKKNHEVNEHERNCWGKIHINPAFQMASSRKVNWSVKGDRTATNRKQVSSIAAQCCLRRSLL